jgi:hypothetical protein
MSDCAAPTPDTRYRLDDQRLLRGDARWEIEIIDPKAIALREKKRTVVSAWASAKATAVKNRASTGQKLPRRKVAQVC